MKLTDMSEKEIMELNAFLAEHAMGLKRVGKIAAVQDGEFFVHEDNGVFVSVKGKMTRLECFKPTTDPAAAMAVLEKCVEKLESFDVCIWHGATKKHWFVGQREDAKDVTSYVKAETLPLAIALFSKSLFSKQ